MIVLLLSTAIIKQMINRLKKKKKKGIFHQLPFLTSGICHHANLDYLIGQKSFLIVKTSYIYIIIQKKLVRASSLFPLEGGSGGSGEQGCISQ